MKATFTIDAEMIAEMRAEQALVLTGMIETHDADEAAAIAADDAEDEAFHLDPQIEMPAGTLSAQPSHPTKDSKEARLARIAHFTKLVEQGKPLFPADEADEADL